MMDHRHRLPRLFVSDNLDQGASITLSREHSHYILNVMRKSTGDSILVFNGRDGEWRATVTPEGRKAAVLDIVEQTRMQTLPGDVHFLFAPLKTARLDYMAQKATEMGASLLAPVITRHTQASKVNLDRLHANAIEAAEQCELLSVPAVAAEEKLAAALSHLEPSRVLIFCDEDAPIGDPLLALAQVPRGTAVAILIGPEGGFAADERTAILQHPAVVQLSLGPRVLRADTAAVASLALVQAVLGDTRGGGIPEQAAPPASEK
jgi:16S rRNA (uracil1498-N3)-methyltransferase